MIKVTLKDGSVKEFESGITAMEVAKSLGMGLYKAACVSKINGEVKDLRTPLTEDCSLEILTFDDRTANGRCATPPPISSLRRSRGSIPRRSSPSAPRSTTASTTTLTSTCPSPPTCSRR